MSLRSYNNSLKPNQKFEGNRNTLAGYIGTMTNASREYNLTGYPRYLKDKGLTKIDGFTMQMNQKGSMSWMYFGKIIDNYHFMNYTRNKFMIGEYTYEMNSFSAYDVTLGNFSLSATRAPTLSIKTIVEPQFPFILI